MILVVTGLEVIAVAAHKNDEKVVRDNFEKTRAIYNSLEGATVCSMGMRGDFELAIRCGSNMVRLGSIIFPGA